MNECEILRGALTGQRVSFEAWADFQVRDGVVTRPALDGDSSCFSLDA